MNRWLFLTSAAALPMLADASLKSAALLVLAGACVLLMRRSSAAARHMVWLAAVVALLLVPMLSIVLPGWRVLPHWAVLDAGAIQAEQAKGMIETSRTPLPAPALPQPSMLPTQVMPEVPVLPFPGSVEHTIPAVASVPSAPEAISVPQAPDATPAAAAWLFPVWLTGCVLLLVRLGAAHFLLRRATRRCGPAAGPVADAFAAAVAETGHRQPVRLLIDRHRTIPVVWGLFRPRLLLPAEAATWPEAQLRSVLLHELAHLRRRDPLVQFLAQLACALHWFNPLVWLAAWRLHVERERACDDMVLASGVRPSTYAEHLLHIATQLSPARWTQACGLAMARKSSLEGRLTAVLSDKLNRRRLTRALTAAAILLSAAIAVPIAMLRAQEIKPVEKKSPSSEKPDAPPPTDRKSEKGTFSAADMELFDWEFGNTDYDPREKFDPEELTRLAKGPDESATDTEKSDHLRRLSWLIARAAAGKDASFKHLLNDASLEKDPSLLLALSGYDYAVNGNRKALDYLLAELAKTRPGSDAQELIPLAFLDEWELTIAGYEKHFASGTDGAAGIAKGLFWAQRKCLFPQQFEAYLARKAGMTKLDPSTEAQLDWGEPANGLRGALVIRPTAPGAEPGIYLAVQNVTEAALRFSDSMAAKDLRKLYLSDSSGILMALTSSKPTQTDVVLQPREVAFLRQFDPVASGEQSVEPAMIEGIRKDSLQTWRAVLTIENAPEGAWTGKLTTGETRCATTEGPQPKSEEGRALFKLWQDSARLNGDIPGGLVSLLHDKVQEFIRNNEPDASGAPYAAKMKPLEPRFGELRDWKPAELIALLDDIAAASTIPLETTLHHLTRNTLRHGQPLPAALEKADWGKPLESGLRMAYLLEPHAEAYHLGTEVKARILLHNSGREPVAFITGSFHQPGYKAQLADGSELILVATDWLTRSVPQAWRLAPGEYIELHTPGLGIGAQNKDRDDWASVRAGSWILCGDGDQVTFLPGGIMLSGADSKLDGEPRPWWPEFITDRLNREAPMPADTKEREYLLYRVVRDLFGTAPSTTEGDAFAADQSPDALKNLAALLTKHAYGKQAQGMIQPGETKFRVLPPDSDAARRVRVASNPGYYNLSDSLKLSVTRRAQGARIINEASLIYFQQGKDNAITKVELPDGYNTWAAAQEPGTTVLWIKQKDLTRRYDFTDPAQIKETRYEGPESAEAPMPARVLEAMKPILAAPQAPVQQQNSQPPAATPEKKDTAEIDELVRRVAAATEKSSDDIKQLRDAILRACVHKRPELQHLLKDEKLKQADDELQSIRLALAAYDYSLNGNKEALQFILDKVATVTEDVSDEVALDTLAWIDEWELSTAAHDKHASRIYGAQVDGPGMFWEQREDLFPEKYAKHFAKAQQAARMDAASLRGVWKGSKDGISVELRMGDKNKWDIRQGDKTISKAVITTHTPPGGSMVELIIQEVSKEMAGYAYSWLKRGSDGALYLHLYREAAQQRPSVVEVPLERQADAPEPPAPTPGPKTSAADVPVKPQHEYAQALLKSWQRYARSDGKIPGALIGRLAGSVDSFVKQSPNHEAAPKLAALRPKLDSSRDWSQTEVVELLDEIAVCTTDPLSWGNQMLGYWARRLVLRGEPLPKDLETAAWGKPEANGLRAAWLLEPRAEQYAVYTELKARVLFHNSGKEPVVFQTDHWHRVDDHHAVDAKGMKIPVKPARDEGTEHALTFRLAPGEFCEVEGVKIAVGACENWEAGGVTVIEAKEGDAVSVSHEVEAGSDAPDPDGGFPDLMLEQMKQATVERIALEAPLPRSAADRELLIRRVTLDLTGVPPSPEVIAAFTADDSADALEKLSAHLQANPLKVTWSGSLPTGETKFRVLPAAPSAPRTARGPGRYVLSDGVQLQVRQVTEGGQRTNSAEILFFGPDPKKESPHKPHVIALPDDFTFAWQRGSGQLWLLKDDYLWRFTFTAEGGLSEEGRYDLWPATVLSRPMKRALLAASGRATAVDVPPLGDESLEQVEDVQQLKQMHVKLRPETEAALAWGPAVNGLRAALVPMPGAMEVKPGAVLDYNIVLQNVSGAALSVRATFPAAFAAIQVLDAQGKAVQVEPSLVSVLSGSADVTLEPQEIVVATLLSTGIGENDPNAKSPRGRTIGQWFTPPASDATLSCRLEIRDPGQGSWTGTLTTGPIKLQTSGATTPGGEVPKTSEAGPRRKVDWSKPPPDSFFEGKYDPALLARLAAKPEKLNEDTESGTYVWLLAEQILRAAVEGDAQFRHLLADDRLKAADIDNRILTMSLAAYDYSVFGNKAALKVILERLESGQNEDYLTAFYLGFVDEWDQSIPAVERVFAHRDGGKGDEYHGFWAHRQWFFPESYAAFQKKQLESNKLDAASLQGVWKGSKEDVDVTLRFGKSQDWEVRFLKTDRKSELSTEPSYTATRLYLKAADEKWTPVHCGTLSRGSDGALLLHVLEHGGKRGDLGYRRVSGLVLKKEADAPKGADAGQRRKVDWSKFPSYDELANPFDPAEALRVAAAVAGGSEKDVRRLMFLILQAAVERAPELQPLLKHEGLMKNDDHYHSIGLALGAYDYAVNGNRKGLQFIIDELAKGPPGGDVQAAIPLGFIDEWDVSMAAHEQHFAQTDGAGAESEALFWDQRMHLFPGSFEKFQTKRLVEAGLDAISLRGTWLGTKDNVSVTLTLGQTDKLVLKSPEAETPAELGRVYHENGRAVTLLDTSVNGGPRPRGRLERQADGALLLSLWPLTTEDSFPHVMGMVLSKQTDTLPPSAPDKSAAGRPKTASAKLTPDALLGAWRGTVNGEKLMLSFHRPPAEKDVQCDIYFGEATIGALAGFTIGEDGGSAEVVQHTAGGGMKFGTLIPSEPDQMILELYGRQQGQQETMLTRDAEPPVSNEKNSSTQPEAGAKLDRAKLEGTWEGEKDGATVKVEFQWLSEHQQVQWEVKRPGSSIAAEMSVVMAPHGNSAEFIFRKGLEFQATQGRVTAGEGGTLNLEIIPNPNVSEPGYPAVKGLILKRKQAAAAGPDVQTPAAAPPAAASEYVTVTLAQDGSLSYESKAVTLEELKTTAAENAKKWFTIQAGEEVPHARAVEVLDTLRGAGVAEITFSEGRMGDGRYRIANRTGNYQFDETHKFSICMPSGRQQWFTVIWPAKDGRPARRLRFYPELSAKGRTPWAVAWEPGANVLWWVDDAHLGRITLDDPDKIIVLRAPRMSSSDPSYKQIPPAFTPADLPDELKSGFRRLGYAVGHDGPPGTGPAGVCHSAETLSAEVLNENGTAVDHPQVRPGGEWSTAWRELSTTVAAARGTPEADVESLIAWGDTKDGLRSGVLMTDRVKRGGRTEARLVLRNVSDKSVTVNLSPVPNRIDVTGTAADGSQLRIHKVVLFGIDPSFSYTFKPGEQLEFPAPAAQFGVERDASGAVQTPSFPVCGLDCGTGTMKVRYALQNVHAPDSGEMSVTVTD